MLINTVAIIHPQPRLMFGIMNTVFEYVETPVSKML